MLIYEQWFHAVFTRQSSDRKAFLPDDCCVKTFMKPLVADKHPCY